MASAGSQAGGVLILSFNRKPDISAMQHWLQTQPWSQPGTDIRPRVNVCDGGFWVERETTRHTNRGTERKKRFIMFVIVVPNGAQPYFSQLTLKRSIDLVAKTRQPRTERQSGMFSDGHQQNIRLVKDREMIVQCYGAHILRMSGRTPNQGGVIPVLGANWMMWDDHPIDMPMLLDLLQFELDPDTFNALEPDTMHKPRMKEQALFDIGVHELDEDEE